MPKLLTVIAVIAAVVLLAASSTMNYLFASSLGRTALEGVVLGVVAVGVDVLKAVLAVVLGIAAKEKRWGFFAIGCFAFVLFGSLSLTASFGFSASNRSAVFGERERQNGKLAGAEAQISDLRGKLKTLPAYRPLPVVEEAMAVARSEAAWIGSKQCTVITKAAREYCDGFGRLRTERAAALEGARLEALMAVKDAEAELLRGAGSGLATDPQAKALASSIGLDEGQVQRGLMALLAIVIEVASGLGVFLALGDGLGTKPASRRSDPEAVPTEKEAAEALVEPKPAEPARVEAQTDAQETPAATVKTNEPHPGLVIGVRSTPRATRRNGSKAN